MLTTQSYLTQGGITVHRKAEVLDWRTAIDEVKDGLRTQLGTVFASGYEYPGRYNRWDIGFYNPPLQLSSCGREFEITARNDKGHVLVAVMADILDGHADLKSIKVGKEKISAELKDMPAFFAEEERSRQPSLFTILRTLIAGMGSKEDSTLGFYGAFGYDLVFQFEPIDLRHSRKGLKDTTLFLPDEVVMVDRRLEIAHRLSYEFEYQGLKTQGMSRDSKVASTLHEKSGKAGNDHSGAEYADKVREIQEGCKRGDYFEVVLSQVFALPFEGDALDVFARIQRNNPSPYEFLIHLDGEQLVGASPEMFVRVEGRRVETCPISGTVARGKSPMEDSDQIQVLLSSSKDEAELTMCTDVDRNDKSRVCVPGSVKVLGRRLIEKYSRVIHTVDHVEGELQEGRDALDAFLSHLWAVTVSGSPKAAAMQQIEDLENSAREWFGGAVGVLGFNGDINTGITIRTVHLKEGVARVRVGATLLAASDPDSEQRETEIKAEAFLNAVAFDPSAKAQEVTRSMQRLDQRKVLFVDHRDSFVHTLASYVRQTGAEVLTLRSGFPMDVIDTVKPDMIFLSPGPFTPSHFGLPTFIKKMMELELPMFGVCLGMQGMVEAMGGELGILPVPQHGVRAEIDHGGKGVFAGLPDPLLASRYHSLYAIDDKLPDCFEVTARSQDGIIMGLAHKEYPMQGVQFHPESIHALRDEVGLRLVENAMRKLLEK